MPQFQPTPKKAPQQKASVPAKRGKNAPQITVKQCHSCASPHRDLIETLIVRSVPFTEIANITGVDRRSISKHAKEHLQWEKRAIQRILEEEAEKDEVNIEEGMKGVTARRAYLKIALEKAKEAILNDDVLVTPKEALGIIDKLDEYEGQITGARLDAINAQFQAFLQAMRELVPQETLVQVLERTRQIVDGSAIEIIEIEGGADGEAE